MRLSKLVTASGDETGATDTARINRMIGELELDSTDDGHATLLFSDDIYYVDEGIVVGDLTDMTAKKSINLVGVGHSVIRYVGDTTTDYLLTITGANESPTARLGGIELDCDGKCRGLLVHRQDDMARVERTLIRDPYQVGLDLVSCSQIRVMDVKVTGATGIAMRLWKSHGATLDACRITACTSADWPAIDDDTVTDADDADVVTLAAQRAPLVIASHEMALRGLRFDTNTTSTLPLVHIDGTVAYGVEFVEHLWFEDNDASVAYIVIDGPTDIESVGGQHYLFRNIAKHDDETVSTIIKTTGYVDRVVVDGVRGSVDPPNVTSIVLVSGESSVLYRSEVSGTRMALTEEEA